MFTSFITTAARQHDLKLSPQNSSALKHTHLKWHILWGKRVSVHHLSGSSAHKILGNWYLSLDLTTKHMFLCQYFFPSTNREWLLSSSVCLQGLSYVLNIKPSQNQDTFPISHIWLLWLPISPVSFLWKGTVRNLEWSWASRTEEMFRERGPWACPEHPCHPAQVKLLFLLMDMQATKPDDNSRSVEKTGISSP